jgi:hypothetical protein
MSNNRIAQMADNEVRFAAAMERGPMRDFFFVAASLVLRW